MDQCFCCRQGWQQTVVPKISKIAMSRQIVRPGCDVQQAQSGLSFSQDVRAEAIVLPCLQGPINISYVSSPALPHKVARQKQPCLLACYA